jgi:hypothetical protein
MRDCGRWLRRTLGRAQAGGRGFALEPVFEIGDRRTVSRLVAKAPSYDVSDGGRKVRW